MTPRCPGTIDWECKKELRHEGACEVGVLKGATEPIAGSVLELVMRQIRLKEARDGSKQGS